MCFFLDRKVILADERPQWGTGRRPDDYFRITFYSWSFSRPYRRQPVISILSSRWRMVVEGLRMSVKDRQLDFRRGDVLNGIADGVPLFIL